jgi:hypothetical protein
MLRTPAKQGGKGCIMFWDAAWLADYALLAKSNGQLVREAGSRLTALVCGGQRGKPTRTRRKILSRALAPRPLENA